MRILVIRFSALGDVAMTVPVVLQVLEQNPDVHIDFLTRPFMAKMLPNHERLRAVGADVDKQFTGFWGLRKLAVKLKKVGKYDAIADLHFVLRSRTISFFLNGSKVKLATMDKGRAEKKKLTRKENKVRGALRPMTERYADVFRKLGLTVELPHELHPKENRSGIGFAPFAQHKGKAWPLQHARELLETLSSEGEEVVLYGGPNEVDALGELAGDLPHIRIHKGTGIANDIESMQGLKLMISMDSANMHLASLAHIPVVSIWGATHPDAGFLGYGQKVDNAVQVSTDELSCRPCSVFGNVPCHRGDWACMENLSSEKVHTTVKKVLAEQSH